MATIHPDRFPSLRAAARRPDQFDAAVYAIADGVAFGSIRNIVLKDAKDTISRAVDDGWEKAVQDPFFFAGRYQQQPEAVYQFYNSFTVMYLHDMLSVSKKLAKTKLDGAAIDAMRAFVAEALPLAEAVASLKDKVVKGRAPSTGPAKPVNPNKIVKTCPCCFRQIAVTNGTMAHHGYQRPGYGWQTASCPGVRFKPLEISNEGLLWMIETTKTSLAKDRAALADSDKLESITPLRGETVRVGETGWARQLAIYIAGLESTIRQAKGWLSVLEKRLAEWRPSE
ncbi:hypothetical protein Brsp07_04510 [Brucella sp. NBRC 14130]|uniref:hypothetical protein n=1 Tax=Brucella sp. NBRC 14130 TaxID=3075483 RepID=UPI0030963C20